jgi:hypothetical protein
MKRRLAVPFIALFLLSPFIAGCKSPSAVSLPDLTGRWNGMFGADHIREVLMLTQNDHILSGTSFFENDQGRVLSTGQGMIRGKIQSFSDVTFTLKRDSMIFEWHGTVNSNLTVLTGKFNGYSNDAKYFRAR